MEEDVKDKNDQNEDEVYEPLVNSPDPKERKLARRLRIQKRLEAVRKQHLQEGEAEPEQVQKTLSEQQVQDSALQIETLLLEGRELVTNVRVANDAREVRRREDQVAARENRFKHLEEEAADSIQKFEAISEKWEEISKSNDPLDIFHDMALQKDKCMELIEQKNQLIKELRLELKKADDRFNRDQRKQKEDLALLVERIDAQVNVMRRAYRQELKLIEQAIAIERKQLLEVNNKRWDILYKEREKEEVLNVKKKFEQVAHYEEEIHNINIEHQEKYRESKIRLESDIQILQQELQQVKALCLLNSEKLDYNYQVLKKRDDENIIMKAQQKRRINKLQDVVNGLKKKIIETENMTTSETRRLTDEVTKLHHNIIDIERKADHFSEINDKKYQQVWEMNKNTAKMLLDKILTTDRIIHEQQLGLDWDPPDMSLLSKHDLPSYRSAMQVVAELFKKKDVGCATSIVNSLQNIKSMEEKEFETLQVHEKLMRHILQRIADNSGFLIENRLKSLLFPYKRCEKTLVKIDNVFSALGITTEADMLMLKEFFVPYIHCNICGTIPSDIIEESEIATGTSVLDTDSVVSFTMPSVSKHEIIPSSLSTKQSSLKELGRTPSKDKELLHGDSQDIKILKRHCAPDHPLTIDPIYVLKALREFVTKFSKRKEMIVMNMSSRLTHKRSTISRLLSVEDVTTYWTRFRQIFSPEREKLWDGLIMGLHKYHNILEERHKLNVETEHLRQQNAELRRLLHRYMLATGTDGNFPSSRDVLPPIKQMDTSSQQQLFQHSVMGHNKSSSNKSVKMVPIKK